MASSAPRRAYVKLQKNDTIDAEAVVEAVTRPGMGFVPIKSPERLDLEPLHRAGRAARRTAIANQIRGFLLDRKIAHRRWRMFCRPGLTR